MRNMIPPLTIDALLALTDVEFTKHCRFESYKSGGPGGQKRNKTSSAAKMTHVPTGISAHSNDFRLQSANRLRALHRLRFKLATAIRTTVQRQCYEPPAWLIEARVGGKLTTNTRNPAYARVAAHVLDVLVATDARFGDCGALLGITTSHLVHFLKAEPTVWRAASKMRAAANVSVGHP